MPFLSFRATSGARVFARVQDHAWAPPFPVGFSLLVRTISWQTLVYQPLALTQENTEETSGKPETVVLHWCGMLSVPLRDSDPRLWEFLPLGSYFCHILSTPVCCWVGGKIKAT